MNNYHVRSAPRKKKERIVTVKNGRREMTIHWIILEYMPRLATRATVIHALHGVTKLKRYMNLTGIDTMTVK